LAESVTATKEAVDIDRRLASVDPQAYHDDLAAELINLTGALSGMGRYGEALPPAQEATTIFARLRGLDLELASAQRNLAIVLGHLDRYDEAVPAVESAVAIFRRLAVD
jgi:tetratricopeptide (TPR) repeat protein